MRPLSPSWPIRRGARRGLPAVSPRFDASSNATAGRYLLVTASSATTKTPATSRRTCSRAYRGLRGFRGQSSLATWLYRIGVNVCLNRVSARKLLSESIADRQFVDETAESPPDRLLKDERGARVRAAIAQLPRKQRATLVLRMYHEMSHQEIADVLGSSVGAVKANFFHALSNLKKMLGGEVL
jgi:RNA polymerase sigma-70 factor (ECF subfamily)